jgi:hypothetical protein
MITFLMIAVYGEGTVTRSSAFSSGKFTKSLDFSIVPRKSVINRNRYAMYIYHQSIGKVILVSANSFIFENRITMLINSCASKKI